MVSRTRKTPASASGAEPGGAAEPAPGPATPKAPAPKIAPAKASRRKAAQAGPSAGATPTPPGPPPLLTRLLLQNGDYGLILWGTDFRITGWHMGATRIFGYAADEIVGLPAEVLFTPEDASIGQERFEAEVAARCGASENARWMIRKDGVRFWATGVLMPLTDDEGRLAGYAKIVRNQTDLRGQITALENQLAGLREAERRKDEFLGRLAHELRNPLAAIVSAAELIRATADAPPEPDAPCEVILRQADSLRHLVDELLDVTRIATGKLRLDLAPLDLGEAVMRSVETCRHRADEKRQTVEVFTPARPVVVAADGPRLRQVFGNLIQNAVKYSPAGKRIWVEVLVEDSDAVVRVRDEGAGIRPEMVPKIFELFTQADGEAGTINDGLGIGLTVARDLVSMHGGTIQARSDGAGRGSEFTVRLPLAPPETVVG